jgi:hypothetical protein
MKNQVLMSLIAAGFAAVLGTTPAAAQTRQTATIPFAFEAGGAEYSQGDYVIERISEIKAVKITNLTTHKSGLVMAPILSGTKDGASKLVFRQVGDRLTLGEVWFLGLPGMETMSRRKDVSAKVVVGLK